MKCPNSSILATIQSEDDVQGLAPQGLELLGPLLLAIHGPKSVSSGVREARLLSDPQLHPGSQLHSCCFWSLLQEQGCGGEVLNGQQP